MYARTKWSKADAENLVAAIQRGVPKMSDDDVQLIASVAHIPADKVRIIVDLAEKRQRELLAAG